MVSVAPDLTSTSSIITPALDSGQNSMNIMSSYVSNTLDLAGGSSAIAEGTDPVSRPHAERIEPGEYIEISPGVDQVDIEQKENDGAASLSEMSLAATISPSLVGSISEILTPEPTPAGDDIEVDLDQSRSLDVAQESSDFVDEEITPDLRPESPPQSESSDGNDEHKGSETVTGADAETSSLTPPEEHTEGESFGNSADEIMAPVTVESSPAPAESGDRSTLSSAGGSKTVESSTIAVESQRDTAETDAVHSNSAAKDKCQDKASSTMASNELATDISTESAPITAKPRPRSPSVEADGQSASSSGGGQQPFKRQENEQSNAEACMSVELPQPNSDTNNTSDPASTADEAKSSNFDDALPRPFIDYTPIPLSPVKPVTTHASLPLELWLEIFRYATYVPRTRFLKPEDPFAPMKLTDYAWAVNAPVRAFKTKTVLVKVCKAWRHLATVVLYEHIVINSVRKAKLVIQALVSSSERGKASEGSNDAGSSSQESVYSGHGEWIRHIEIHTTTRSSNRLYFLQCVAYILTRCPNLQYLTGSWTHSLPREFLQSVAASQGKNLLGMSLGIVDRGIMEGAALLDRDFLVKNAMHPKEVLSPTFMAGFLNLRVLDLRTVPKHLLRHDQDPDNDNGEADDAVAPWWSVPPKPSKSNDASGHTKAVITLPHVSTLYLPTTPTLLAYATTMALPSLHSVIIDASYTPQSAFAPFPDPLIVPSFQSHSPPPPGPPPTPLTLTLFAFLTAHGPAITTLELIPYISPLAASAFWNNPDSTIPYPPSPSPLSPALFLQPRVCPNLERLVWDCREKPLILPLTRDVMSFGRKSSSLRSNPNSSLVSSPSTSISSSSSNPWSSTTSVSSYFPSYNSLPREPHTPFTLPIDPTTLTTNQYSSHYAPHTSLRSIGIRGLGISRLYPNKPTHSQNHLIALLTLLEAGVLPNVERVMTLGFLVGKSTDSMASDIFIWWGERFERCRRGSTLLRNEGEVNGEGDEEVEMGVDFIDGEGVLWIYEDEKSKKVEVKKEKGKEKEIETEKEVEQKDKEKDIPTTTEEEKTDAIEVEEVLAKTQPEDSIAPTSASDPVDGEGESREDEDMDIEGEEDNGVEEIAEEEAESVLIPMDDHPMLVHKTDPGEMATKLLP